jgi:hypothetical protein
MHTVLVHHDLIHAFSSNTKHPFSTPSAPLPCARSRRPHCPSIFSPRATAVRCAWYTVWLEQERGTEIIVMLMTRSSEESELANANTRMFDLSIECGRISATPSFHAQVKFARE